MSLVPAFNPLPNMNLSLKTAVASFAAATLLATVASTSFGATLTLNTNTYSGSYGGGEFTASNSGLDLSSYSSLALNANQTGFSTFCMEYGEHFSPGSTYSYSLSDRAFGGDVAGGGGDPVSLGTAWLYSQFAQGILDGYNYTNTAARKASNTQLQLAFWYLEDEIVGYFGHDYAVPDFSLNPFLNAVSAKFGSLSDAKADANGAYGVQILNLTSNNGKTANQSQLYYHSVPDAGATLALLGLAFLGLAGFKRKFAESR